MLKTAGLVKRGTSLLSLFYKMSKEEIDRVLQGGKIFRDISWRGRFSIRIPLGINEKMKREKILRSKQCCSQCCSKSLLSPKQCFSPKKHNMEREKDKIYGLAFVNENFSFSISLAFSWTFSVSKLNGTYFVPLQFFFDCQAV